MKIRIGEFIRNRRRERNISQEALAEEFGVSVQAVSKWETGASFPDITLLPTIAEYFDADLNELFFCSKSESQRISLDEIKDDEKLRIVQLKGRKILSVDKYDPSIRIMLKTQSDKTNDKPTVNVEIWGNADIQGDINGNLSARQGVNCGRVEGNVTTESGVNCGGVGGNVDAGCGVNCGHVKGSVNSGGGVNCGGIGGDVTASHDIHCSEIKGDVSCQGNIFYEK